MRRRVAWAAVLLVVGALAGPALAAPPAGTGAIHGRITDAVGGTAFAVGPGGGVLSVDAFSLDTMARTVVWVTDVDGDYVIPDLAPGQYKVRFRYWDGSGQLTHYRWNSDKATFEVANPVTVVAHASFELDAALRPLRGAQVSGQLLERGTGIPLTGDCYSVQLFEASGISMGHLYEVDASGDWSSLGKVPAGKWTALATYSLFDPALCGISPPHLDTWYQGASGWPLFQSNLVAHWATFYSAATFDVVIGVPVTHIDIEMLKAPTCRGKTPTIFGTTLADEIVGTPGRDIISGLAGNDWIGAGAGNDLVCGDAGTDNIDAGPGVKDIIDGGGGTDTCANGETTYRCELTP